MIDSDRSRDGSVEARGRAARSASIGRSVARVARRHPLESREWFDQRENIQAEAPSRSEPRERRLLELRLDRGPDA